MKAMKAVKKMGREIQKKRSKIIDYERESKKVYNEVDEKKVDE